jgi:hypothetical protein
VAAPTTTTTEPTTTTVVTESTPVNPTTTVTGSSATTVPAQPGDGEVIGLLGCSMTRDAVDGYIALGGTQVWDLDDQYGNGSVTRWALPQSPLWGRFDRILEQYPGTEFLWWHLCTAHSEDTTMDLAQIVLGKLRERLPDATLYISAQPDYSGGHVCEIAGVDGPGLMEDLAATLIEMGEGLVGPEQGPLAKSDTNDGCHANDAGKVILGGQLADFLTSLES